jgi:hypothetical protein
MKIRPVGAEFFHADRWTDRYDESNSGFSQFRECKNIYGKLYISSFHTFVYPLEPVQTLYNSLCLKHIKLKPPLLRSLHQSLPAETR